MIFTKPAQRIVSAGGGPITLDQVRDGAAAVWVGPSDPVVVMLFDSSGTDWMHGTNYNFVLGGNANWKSGADGGLNFPQSPVGDYATCDPIPTHINNVTGPGSVIVKWTSGSLPAWPYLAMTTTARTDGNGIFYRNSDARIQVHESDAIANIPSCYGSNGTHVHGFTYDPPRLWDIRFQAFCAGARIDAKANIASEYLLRSWGLRSDNSALYFPGTIGAMFVWNKILTDQEMHDYIADPDSLFAAA